ncbi:MAG: peptidase M19, partial [Candidatus Thermofonsia Clade 1 bacterium]
GAESTPDGLDTVADLLSLAPLLAARGYSQSDVAAILSGNFLSVLRAALP